MRFQAYVIEDKETGALLEKLSEGSNMSRAKFTSEGEPRFFQKAWLAKSCLTRWRKGISTYNADANGNLGSVTYERSPGRRDKRYCVVPVFVEVSVSGAIIP